MQDRLNTKKTIVTFKEQLLSAIPYVPKNAESKQFLLSKDIGVLLHIHHFWRQRFLPSVARKYHAPSNVRNDPQYVSHKEKIELLKRKIEIGEDLSAYLSRRTHAKALDVNGYRQSGNFSSSRDQLLVCEGFYHLHLEPLPDRTDEILVAKVTPGNFEVIGLFTHELFIEYSLNREYVKYNEAVDNYLKRTYPAGGTILGGPGGGMVNCAGSSIASSFWQTHYLKILNRVETHSDGIEGFTIQLYKQIFDRQTRYVSPKWDVADDGRLLLRDKKNKYEFWMEPDERWKAQPCDS